MLIQILISLQLAYGHGGRTDSKGGHSGPGGYHYHSNSSSGSSSYNNYSEYNTFRFKYPQIVKGHCDNIKTIKEIDGCIYKIEELQNAEKKKYSKSRTDSDREYHKTQVLKYEHTLIELDAIREEKAVTKFTFVTLGIVVGLLLTAGLFLG